MKKLENSFAVTGFIGKDAEIRSFQTASVARFSIAISPAQAGKVWKPHSFDRGVEVATKPFPCQV